MGLIVPQNEKVEVLINVYYLFKLLKLNQSNP